MRYICVCDENPHSVDMVSLLYSGLFFIIRIASLNRISLSHVLKLVCSERLKYSVSSYFLQPKLAANEYMVTLQSLYIPSAHHFLSAVSICFKRSCDSCSCGASGLNSSSFISALSICYASSSCSFKILSLGEI